MHPNCSPNHQAGARALAPPLQRRMYRARRGVPSHQSREFLRSAPSGGESRLKCRMHIHTQAHCLHHTQRVRRRQKILPLKDSRPQEKLISIDERDITSWPESDDNRIPFAFCVIVFLEFSPQTPCLGTYYCVEARIEVIFSAVDFGSQLCIPSTRFPSPREHVPRQIGETARVGLIVQNGYSSGFVPGPASPVPK